MQAICIDLKLFVTSTLLSSKPLKQTYKMLLWHFYESQFNHYLLLLLLLYISNYVLKVIMKFMIIVIIIIMTVLDLFSYNNFYCHSCQH